MPNRFLNNITINDEYTFPSSDGSANQVIATDGSGNLSFVNQSGGASLSGGEANKVAIWSATDTLTHHDNFHFDTANVRLGIGDSNPNRTLVVSETRTGSTASDAYTAIVKSVQSSGASPNPGTGGLKVQYTSSSSNVHAFGLVAGSSSSDFLTTGPMHFYTNSDLDTVSATGFAMQLDTSQRLTIGSMTASQKLNVSGSVTADRYYGNTSTVYYVDPNDSTQSAYLASRVRIRTSSSYKSTALEVTTETGTSSGEDGVFIKNYWAGGSPVTYNKHPYLSLGTAPYSGAISTIYMGASEDPNAQQTKIQYSHSTLDLTTYVKGNTGGYVEHVRYGDSSSNTARTKFSGNVGIGVDPTEKLHVNGDFLVNNTSGAANGSPHEIARLINTTSGATSSYMYIGASSGNDWRVGKNILGTLGGSNFGIALHSGSTLALEIDGSSNVISNVSSRAPIFYDSSNTSYYVDPANSTKAAHLRGDIEIINEQPLLELNDYTATNTTNLNAWVSFQYNGTEGGYVGYGSDGNSNLYLSNYNGSVLITGASAETDNSFRAPVFYDTNNTSYYLDPASLGVALHINGIIDQDFAVTNLNSAWTAPGTSRDQGFIFGRFQSSASNAPATNDNANWFANIYSHASGGTASYGIQLAGSNAGSGENALQLRNVSNGSFSSWRKVYHEGHVPTYSELGTMAYSNLTGTPSSLPANGGNSDTVDSLHAASFLRSDANDTWSGDISTTSTNGIRFGNANQTDANDGLIAAGRFASGLNIVGTQTATGTGRQIRLWGDLITNTGDAYWHAGNLVTTSTGNRWDVVPTVSSSGVLEAGKYIDFHESDTTTSDYDYRITSTSGRLYFSGDIEIDGGDIYINDGNTRITEGVSNSLRAQTNSGYIDIGPQNTSHCHIRTDRSNFYFDKELQVNTGVVRSYDEDLNLNRAGSTTARLRITSGVTYSDQYLQASGSLRAPIFYDSNDTNYKLDPNGTSNLNHLNVAGTFRFQRSAYTQTGQDDNVTVTVGDSDITFTHNNDDDGDASVYNFKYTSGGSAIDILNFASNYAEFNTPYVRCRNNSTDYAQLESNSSGGVLKAVSNGNTNVLLRSYGDSYTLNDLGVGISTPAARLHVDHPTTTTPVLSFGGAAGQILQSENSEFAFGLTSASPYPLYIQGRNSGNAARNINLQPIGGNIGITQASPSHRLHVNGNVMANRYYGATSTSYYLDPNQTGDSIRVIGDIVAYYSSDRRYKENIKAIESPIEKVKAISGVTFEWNEKSHKETGKKDIGVIAQEVEEVLPEIVQTRDNGYKAVDYQKLTAVLIEAVKDQQKQIDELKSIINGSS